MSYKQQKQDKKKYQTGTKGFRKKRRIVKHDYLKDDFKFDSELKK